MTNQSEMTQNPEMTAPKMTRVAVRVPRTTLDQINEWVDTLGVRRSHFLGIALVAGVRSLMRASALEMALEPVSATGPRSGTAAAGQTAESDATNVKALADMVETLQSQVVHLQTEIAELRAQIHS